MYFDSSKVSKQNFHAFKVNGLVKFVVPQIYCIKPQQLPLKN